MKLGIYGGTFDPIHIGHLILAETARETCGLDEVWFVPAFTNPHKEDRESTSPSARLEMVRFAIAGHPQFRVSDLEIRRRGTSYTIDTLRDILAKHPDAELSLLMGADSLADFVNWREPVEILKLARVIAVNRGRGAPDLRPVLDALGTEQASRFELIEMPAIGLSAGELRASCSAGRSIRYQTPRSVELYIQQHRLYRATAKP